MTRTTALPEGVSASLLWPKLRHIAVEQAGAAPSDVYLFHLREQGLVAQLVVNLIKNLSPSLRRYWQPLVQHLLDTSQPPVARDRLARRFLATHDRAFRSWQRHVRYIQKVWPFEQAAKAERLRRKTYKRRHLSPTGAASRQRRSSSPLEG